MDSTIKIIGFAGSLRKESYNKMLLKIALAGAFEAGAEVNYIDLKEYPMPIYDQDFEDSEGLPENALKLKELMVAADGFLIASPEYNSSISSALKNTIDWVSRKANSEEPNLHCFKGKVASLMSASPGALGGLRGLVHLRAILGNIGLFLLPDQIAVGKAFEAFNDEGKLLNEKKERGVMDLGKKLVETVRKLKTTS